MVKYKILSVGGSILIPKTGFDIDFLKAFRRLILRHIRRGEKFILVVGGGSTCRAYQQAARSVTPLKHEDLDWLGIATTVFNAKFVQTIFGDIAHKDIITDPNTKLITKKSLILAAGWRPGFTTDHSAVKLAKTYDCQEVYNLSNIAYVYDKDPNVFSDAKKIEKTDWMSFCRDIIPKKMSPGMNTPFDPMASKLAAKLKLKVSFVDGRNLAQLDKALGGKKFEGTIVR